MIRNTIVNWLAGHLLKMVSDEDILTISGKDYFLRKHKLSSDELATLKAEAKEFQDSILWKLMKKELEFAAYMKSLPHAKTEQDTLFAKAMFYNLDQQRKYLERLSNL